MPIRSVTLKILGDSQSARAQMDWVNAAADKLNKKKVNIDIGATTPEAKLAALRIKLDALKNMHTNLTVDVNDKPSQLAFARINQQLLSLDRRTAKPKVSVEGLAKAQADIITTGMAFDKLIVSTNAFGQSIKKQDTLLSSIFRGGGGGGFGGFMRFFGGKFVLFGGLATIGTLHLLVDVVAEVLAVVLPATIALAAFGLAGKEAATNIFTHMKNMNTVISATGKQIYPMTGALSKMSEAVRPAVYQIFGDALTVMNSKTGLFQTLATGTAAVMTHLAARMTVAITNGKGMSAFMRNAVPDVAKLGEAFGNLFGILGNILKVLPGYAGVLLSFGTALLKVGERATRVASPLIGAGLAIHGFFIWAGLGASAAFLLGRALVFLGNTAIGGLVKRFAIFIAEIATLALTEGIATAATFAFSAALDFLAANPLVWVGAAVGALAALVFWMSKSKSATQQWGDSLQKGIDNASSVSQGLVMTQSALVLVSNKLGAASAKLANIQQYTTQVNLHTGATTRMVTRAYADQQAVVNALKDQTSRFTQEQQFNQGRLQGLTKAYHGQNNAMALLAAAGVTQQEWQTKGAEGWAIITQKINATIAGYKAMGQTGTTLGNDLQVMDRNIADQYTAMQKLNQAWDTFIGDITGTQGSFDTMALGLKTLAVNFNQANKATHTTAHTLGEVRSQVTITHAAIDGLNQSSLALNQAFTQQVVNTNALLDTWRLAGISNNMFTRGVKDSIAPLTRYAKGSQEATAQLIGLAQEAGYHGPNSMKTLIKWLGNTHDSLRTVKDITNQATIQEALLSGSMRAQGKLISGTLLNDLNMAILKYGGVKKAVDQYAQSIAQWGVHSTQANAKEKTLNTTLIDTMHRAGDSKNAIAAMIAKVDHIPLSKAIKIVETGLGKFSVAMTSSSNPYPGGISGRHAEGWKVPGYGGGDRWPALLEGGEAVVPKHLTPAVAPFLRAHGVPGFAGGVILQGDKGVLSGDAAVGFDKNFTSKFTAAMEKAMKGSMQQAIQAVSVPNVGSGTARWAGLVRQALGMEGLSQALAGRVLYQMQTESGGNPNAINLTDSNAAAGHPSQGLLQTIPGTFSAYHWPGTSWNIRDPLANIAAAINYARHTYGPGLMSGGQGMGSGHGYASGTPGAIAGWAWVGERGPELVKMSGGETVLDAKSSSLITRGYAGGTIGRETNAGLALIHMFSTMSGERHLGADSNTYLKTIAKYFSGPDARNREDMVRRQVAAMENIAGHFGKGLGKSIKAMQTNAKSIYGNLSGYGDLSGLALGPTAGIGDNVALSGGQGLSMQMNTKIANMKAFGNALKRLHNMGLSGSLFSQLVAMGPDSGLPYANELISGGPAFIKKLTGQETALRQAEHLVSQGASSASSLGQWETGKTFWLSLKGQQSHLEGLFKNLGRTLGKEAANWFVPNKRRRPKGFAKGGILNEPVFGVGMSGQEYSFGESGAEYFSPMASPGHGRRGGGGDVYNIYVSGDSDPDSAARQIIQKVRDYKRHHGNQPTGIG